MISVAEITHEQLARSWKSVASLRHISDNDEVPIQKMRLDHHDDDSVLFERSRGFPVIVAGERKGIFANSD